ncbi:MAG: DUF1549 domain-containing protein [Mariniblastus sp.]|nr:DUF1549 domain-containing protein [Mariniblastus sp.]
MKLLSAATYFCSTMLILAFATTSSAQISTVSFHNPSESDADSTVLQINKLVEQVWTDYELKPSKEATDGEWCRRVHLDIIGRVPSIEEASEFMESRASDKKQKLVEKLLYDDTYTEEFARNWTTVWTNLLIGRTGGNDNNSMISRAGMQKYLRDSFAREKPYDRMVHELVTATGSTTPGDEKFNGATNFLIDKVNEEKASLATAATTRIFLGLQVQCTQCHNHPFNDWKQQKYWEMNAFFRQVRAFPGGARARDGGVAQLADQDFRGESQGKSEIFFEMRNGLSKVAYPVFVDGNEIERSGLVNVVNRRKELANMMVASPFLTRSIVNRMWAHFLGYGFTAPVDDLGPHNIPSNPELLEFLSEEFRRAEFDLRKLISWVTLSKPYSLSSRRSSSNQSDDPLLGESPKFSHFYLRQMEAEQLYESMMVATEAIELQGSYEEREQKKNTWLSQFNQAFGTDEGQESTSFNGTIPQVLMLFNGDMVKQAIDTKKGSLIDNLSKSGKNYSQCVEQLFIAGLTRKPQSDEKNLAKQFLKARDGDPKEALRDVWWVILNTNEFIFNH